MARITLDHLAHAYGPNPQGPQDYALKEIDHVWRQGGAYALLGPSGCGKSTLLNIISGLVVPTRGRILFDDRDVTTVPTEGRNIAQVFQFPVVYDTMTVRENLAFPLKNRRVAPATIRSRVEEIAGLLDLTRVLDRRANNLTADMKQKISLGRGLVRPDVAAILFDEPLTVIDPHLKWQLRSTLKELHRKLDLTMIYVTHDQTEAMGLADRIAVMHGGRIEQIDRPTAVYERPATTFVGGFVGSPPMNFLPVSVENARLELAGSSLPAPRASGDLLMGIRAEDLMPVAAGEGLPFDIAVVEPLGAHDLVTGRSGATLLRVAAPAGSGHKPGTRIGLKPDPKRLVWMDPASGRAFPTQ